MTTHSTDPRNGPRLHHLPHRENADLELLSRDGLSWPLAIGLAVILVAAVAFFVYYSRSTDRSHAPADPALEMITDAPPAAPRPLSPTERALAWQRANLAGTAFQSLSIREMEGRQFLVYVATEGDSISGVVKSFVMSARSGPADRDEVFRLARERHAQRYHRGLWPGDEVLLLLEPHGV